MKKIRSIVLDSSTCERLKYEGRKGQTYDDVINNLLDYKKKRIAELGLEIENQG
jgi:hypothetical protein